MIALEEWRHYLIGAEEIFEIWTDHQNLQYFQQLQTVNCRQAHWLTELAQYHFRLHHKSSSLQVKPDFLLRPPGLDKGEKDNKNITLLPNLRFRFLSLRLTGTEVLLQAYPEAIQA